MLNLNLDFQGIYMIIRSKLLVKYLADCQEHIPLLPVTVMSINL